MLSLFPEHAETIRQEAVAAFPNEAVWLITKKGCKLVKNVADDPTQFFEVAPKDLQKAKAAGLLAVVHSHVNGQHYPSEADLASQFKSRVPWGLLTTDGVGSSEIRWWGSTNPEQVEDLEGRTFCHGASDCYALVKDYYLVKLGIKLPEFPRGWRWWDTQNLLEEGFPVAGFSEVKDAPREHDVWLASFNDREGKLNHCGVLLDNDLTHHHPGAGTPVSSSKLAVITPIYPYLPYVGKWVRHKDLA